MTTRPRAAHQVNKPTTLSVPYTLSYGYCDAEDDSDDDNVFSSPSHVDNPS
jgi:hypothetical protein